VILYELFNTEANPHYRSLEISNGNRQYQFLNSVVQIAIDIDKRFLSQTLIKAFNFHAIVCLHTNPGEYRPCPVTVGSHLPPAHYRVPALMDDFVNEVNRQWDNADAVQLATFVLWRLNNIHPFINGNGRTARAASYFVLCVKSGGWLKGTTILPELIRQNRDAYCAALQLGHDSFARTGKEDLTVLHALIVRLLGEQVASITPAAPAANSPSTGAKRGA
jgi:Fic/DOC family protein